MEVEVIRSANRRKTVQARLVNGVVQVFIPARMTKAEEAKWVNEMVGRFERQRATQPIDLAARAEVLAARHGLEQPRSIRWVDNQEWRWGSCTPSERTIRISSRLAGFPSWVLDYVIVHELAHLTEPGHDACFWALVGRYPKTERARGFLIAKGLDDADGSPPAGAGPAVPALRRPRAAPRVEPPAGAIEAQPTLW